MSCRRKSIINYDPDETDEELFESAFATTVLSLSNGYCKINLVVPQTSTFYAKDSLLPINARVDGEKLNNDMANSQISNTPNNQVTNMLRNVMSPETSGDAYNLDDNEKLEQELYAREKKQEILKIKNEKKVNLTTSRMSNLHKNVENDDKQNTTLQSQCPICFELYPTLQIEAHASECNI